MAVGVLFLWLPAAPASAASCPNRDLLASPPNQRAVEIAVLCETNLRRVKAGLSPLVLNEKLSQAARAHGADMYRRGYFDHASPEGKRVLDRVQATGYRGLKFCCGENIAANIPNAAQVVSIWMSSPGHRANILLANAREIGVGVAGAIPHFVQVFSLAATGPGITGLEDDAGRPPGGSGNPDPDRPRAGSRQLQIGLSWRPSVRAGRAFVRIRVPAGAIGRSARVTTVEQRRRCSGGGAKMASRCAWKPVGQARVKEIRLGRRRLQIQVRRAAGRSARLLLRLVVPAWKRDRVSYRRIDERLIIR